MASVIKIKWNIVSLQFYLWIILIGLSKCQKLPRLEILPLQSVQRKPVGKPLLLTCRPDVPDINLVTDLKWRDNSNLTVLPKVTGQSAPAMYTETLPGDQALALIIPYLSEGMSGQYYCSANYANTEILELGVRVETYIAITWKDAPESQFPILGSDYNVRCEVTASPPPTVDWLRNGDPIKSSGRYVVETRGLLIKNVEEADDGIYTCRAAVIQTGELVERNIRVEVQIKPEVSQMPTQLEAVEGQEFSVICNATGKPPPEFSWTKLTTQQNLAIADRFLVNALTGQMSITRVEEQDHGAYMCRAENAAGISESQTFLNVLVRPKIYEFFNITVPIDSETVFNCRATGRPAPQITFRRWGSREELSPGFQANDDRLILEQTTDEERGESTGTLRISKVLRTDDGLYECVARNKGETAYKVGHITVEYPPDFEHMKALPPVFSWEERIANLSCLAQGIPNATIEWRWRDRLIKDLYDSNFEIQGNGPRSDLLIRPVDRQYYSAYKCIATNRLGRAEHMMELREARVPDTVPQAKPIVVTATTMTFEIIGPPTELGLPITAYSVQYKEERNPDWNAAFNRTWSPDSPYIVEGLRPQTSYQFRFAARNQVGIGQFGAYRTQSTPHRSVPEAPKLLHQPVQPAGPEDGEDAIVISPYADHFELRWNVPADNGEPIDKYQVRYCPGFKTAGVWNELDSECRIREVHSTESTHLEMHELKADTYYRIELKAHNAIGYSAPATLQMKTARGLDDMISFVESAALSSAAIVGIAVAGVIIILILVDLLCCVTVNAGVFATLCRKAKRSPSDLDEETKLGRDDEKQPLNMPTNGTIKQHSTVEFDGRVVHSRSGDIIGKNSAV